jgi:hypothetical protein
MKEKKPLRQRKATLSKWNSLKHGLLAKDVVVKFGSLKEDKEQFDQVLTDLRNDLSPEGALEEILVEEIAVCYWRLRRVVRAEVGEIMKAADPDIDTLDEVERMIEKLGSGTLDQAARERLLGTSAGLKAVVSFVEERLAKIKGSGSISIDTVEALKSIFDNKAQEIEVLSYLSNTPIDKRVPLPPGVSNPMYDAFTPEKARQILIGNITIEAAALNVKEVGIKKIQAYKRQIELLQGHVPSSDSLDTISRYETTIKRHLYRAIDQLERLKRRREGEFIPAPIKVDVHT